MNDNVVFALIPIIFIVVTGGVILLYPISRRLGNLLELMTEEKRRKPGAGVQAEELKEILLAIESRLGRLEQHQEFIEQLASGKRLEPAARQARERGEAG